MEKRYIVKVIDTDGTIWMNTGSFEVFSRKHLLACMSTAVGIAKLGVESREAADICCELAFGRPVVCEREDSYDYKDELSDSYLRIRAKLHAYGAHDTKPGGSDRFEKTEAALDALLAQVKG
jgi:hypothetical protein